LKEDQFKKLNPGFDFISPQNQWVGSVDKFTCHWWPLSQQEAQRYAAAAAGADLSALDAFYSTETEIGAI